MAGFSKEEMINDRDSIIDSVRRDLLGPGSELEAPDIEHELISDDPKTRYSIGILYPQDYRTFENDSKEEVDEDITAEDEKGDDTAEVVQCIDDDWDEALDTLEEDDNVEHDNFDEEVNLASQNYPSSCGMTFFVKGKPESVVCRVSFANYRKAKVSEMSVPYDFGETFETDIPGSLSSKVIYDKARKCIRFAGDENANAITNLTTKELKAEMEANAFGECGELYKALCRLATIRRRSFVREPHSQIVKICFGDSNYVDNNRDICDSNVKVTALRRELANNTYSVSLMLVNDASDKRGDKSVFQPEIVVASNDNTFAFADANNGIDYSSLSEESLALEMEYRHKKNYGTGMGVSVDWKIDENGSGVIRTDYFPKAEIAGMDFNLSGNYNVNENSFKMKWLSDFNPVSKKEKVDALKTVVDSYKEWIDSLKIQQLTEDALNDEKRFKKVAEKNISGCEEACGRMYKGLDTLLEDNLAWTAFELANRAMYMQRVHVKLPGYLDTMNSDEIEDFLAEIDYQTVDTEVHDFYSWRPFQLAFLLMSINSIVNGEGDEHQLVDLIWFPTGGGKTEAYLGLMAFVIFFRRLRYPDHSDGTAVLMRYTLRLLTAQQFNRASTLICACEYIRVHDKKKRFGKTPITIGLWIGGEHTPNKRKEACTYVNKLREATVNNYHATIDKYSKFQVLKCPWCGRPMIKRLVIQKKKDKVTTSLVGNFGYEATNRKFRMRCMQDGCSFSGDKDLPIQVVDEELYENPPTLLFATVDKFAMMPWNWMVGRFFGIDTPKDNRAPELVIQDELHLISGPLGTMVGLYETAIEELCRKSTQGNIPKIIASTATIRGAVEQCSALYNRRVVQFPNPGLNAEDSFFAREAKIDHENGVYGREYVGIFPAGKSKPRSESVTIASLLQTVKMMNLPDDEKDNFWTLVSYFNSMKELGKCSNLVNDDVRDDLRRVADAHTGNALNSRRIRLHEELTSRVTTSQLNQTLETLEKVRYTSQGENGKIPADIVLATNMISVGIDIGRLNLMLVVGQPKLASEYIQATSRVGREYPGTAFILYDCSKSRDRSYYERFKDFHGSYYKDVEPTGVTPFSEPARDRALHAVAISLLRILNPELRSTKDAAKFDRIEYKDQIKEIKELITGRCRDIDLRTGMNKKDQTEEIIEKLNEIFERWEHAAKQGELEYGEKYLVQETQNDPEKLMAPYGSVYANHVFEVMTSMRNVDTMLSAQVLIWREDYEI